MKQLLTVILLSAIISCTSSNDFAKGKKLLEQQGFTDVKKTGYNFLCCSKDERYSTGFKATDKNGNVIKGCFCSDLGKGITIRFE